MHGLNPPQRQAVLHVDGPLLVLAGAGSGKTRVIVEKIAHLIRSGRMPAKRIAAITFTNKSAREMRERVARRIKGDAADGLTVSTFHALGLKLLQIEHAKLGLKRGFSIFDSDDSTAQIKDLLPPGSKPDAVDAARNLISRAKSIGLSPQQAMEAAQSVREREAAALYARYQQRLTTFNAVDFDDLIRLPVQLLESDEDCVAAWRERIGYLLVDECQDTNDAQYRLLKAITGPRGDFTCVGDDDQSIYAWRGANPENLLQLGSDYPALQKRGLAALKQEILTFAPESEPVLALIADMQQLLFTSYRHVWMPRWFDRTTLFLGDAAHGMSPHLGQGMNLALVDAFRFSECLRESRTPNAAFTAFRQQQRAYIRYYSLITFALSPFFQSDWPILAWGRDIALPLLPKIPYVKRQMLMTVTGMKSDFFGGELHLGRSH